MITTIDNNQKVFMVTGDMNRSVFCNARNLPEVIATFDDADSVKISFFFNNKPKRAGKKFLNDMFKGLEMNFHIK